MRLFISVISHKHDKIIYSNATLKKLSKRFNVIVKSNTKPTSELIEYCKNNKLVLITNKYQKGFAENNNDVFQYARKNLGMTLDDYFLVLNPDVDVTLDNCQRLLDIASLNNEGFCTVNLFRDHEHLKYDNSIRRFPTLVMLLKKAIKLNVDYEYDKKNINKETYVDWAAGSFLLIKSSIYNDLEGFDKRYFMYYEDVDFCKRAKNKGYRLMYYPNIKATHYAFFKNRNLFSKHFLWYLKSLFTYIYINKSLY